MRDVKINCTAAEIRAYQAGERVIKRRVRPSRVIITQEMAKAVNEALETCLLENNSPFGQPGDRLVLREAWAWISGAGRRTVYRADGPPNDRFNGEEIPNMKWNSSQVMPRNLARYTPTVRAVRVEQIDGAWWWVAELADA